MSLLLRHNEAQENVPNNQIVDEEVVKVASQERRNKESRLSKPLNTDRSGGDQRGNNQHNNYRIKRGSEGDRARRRSRSRSRDREGNEHHRNDSNENKKRYLRDENLGHIDDDPRIHEKKGKKIAKKTGVGRNTESFDPKSTLIRPEMRIIVGPNQSQLNRKIKHDDILIVPNFFCQEDDWSIYYKLIEEMREAQASGVKKSEWTSWHEGAHLISHNPSGSATYQMIQQRISEYFDIQNKSVGTRFNWYSDSSDWKPFHHDSAAFNPQRARNQNITVGVSFGATRELAFLHAQNGSRIYFPQTNGMMFSFGRDVNINWKHGVNALSDEEQAADGRGRISIILWGLCNCTIEEDNSPPMLTDNTRGNGHSMHAARGGADKHQDGGWGRGDHDYHRDGDRDNHYGDTRRPRDNYQERHDDRRTDRLDNRIGGRENRGRGPGRDAGMCKDFERGQCRFGDRCRFSHSY